MKIKELSKIYDPSQVESKCYQSWEDEKLFAPANDTKDSFTIMIPPPNVTGILHIGHCLNNTIQDVLIRRKRMLGHNTLWLPGMDHASIATEAKVTQMLKKNGQDKKVIGREKFLEHAWEWKEEYGGKILNQLKKLGASCDWDRTTFTMDENYSQSVLQAFVDLYNDGLIYKGERIINWDPDGLTALSDEEVIYKEIEGKLWHFKYPIKDSDEFIIVATTRPETMLGDTGIAVNPNDKRYTHLIGKTVVLPIVKREIPIFSDEYVDLEFGTGCVKVTPAHDPNDFEMGLRNKLETINIMHPNGQLNENCPENFQNLNREEARKKVVEVMQDKGLVEKIEQHMHQVGHSERTNAIVEPYISKQWFLKMDTLVGPALDAVKNGEIKFYPEKWTKTYNHWLENIKDWCISRQLWWGHRIPVYYYGEDQNDFVVAESSEKALELAKIKSNNSNLKISDLNQDEDVLDTWFSSWLWPISVFDGINNPDNHEINYYYPTQDLVTGPDILFFWVARMIISGYEFRGRYPFSNVYLTGLVRDEKGQKMSKQLGNSPDALNLIDKYGADGVRVGLMLSSAAGNDLLFHEDLCNQGKNFGNKVWNAYKLIDSWKVDKNLIQPISSHDAINCFNNLYNKRIKIIDNHFEKYRISDALMLVYKLIWDDFCSWLLEILKPNYGSGIDKKSIEDVKIIFEKLLKLLHPFMPFISEELWQSIKKRNNDEALVVSNWPENNKYDNTIIEEFKFISEVITSIRSVRKKQNISFKESIELSVLNKEKFITKYDSIIKKLCNINIFTYVDGEINNAISFRVKTNTYFIPTSTKFNAQEEIKKIKNELDYNVGFLNSVEKKLSNKRFVDNAPENVIEIEKKKKSDAMAKIQLLRESLDKLKN